MSDPEQSPVPSLSEVQEPGSGPRAASSDEIEVAPPLPSEAPSSDPVPSEQGPSSDGAARKRSSIRPAPAGWRPTEAHLRPASPMVVVYSGDSDRPAPNWEGEPTPRGPAVEGARPDKTGPFLPAKDFYRNEMPSGPGLFDALLDEPKPAAEVLAVEVPPVPPRELAPVPALPASVQSQNAANDARNRPTVRVGRVQRAPSVAPGPQRAPSVVPGPRSPSTAPGASVAPASINAAKALAARRQLVSGRPPEPVKPAGVPRGLLLGLLGIAACLGLFLVQRARSRDALAHESAPLSAVVEPSRVGPAPVVLPKSPAREAVASSAELVPPSAPSASPSELSASASPPAPRASTAAPAPAPVPAGSASVRTVTLEVMPPDAKVFSRGLLRKGPPFVFELRPGAHLAVEVVRDGYVARRVVLDGTKSELAVGLMKKRTPAAAARGRGESASTGEASQERGTAVQSGL